MAARLALSRASVTRPEGTDEAVQVVVRNNIAKVQVNRSTMIEKPDVVAVEDVRRGREWTVRFADGETWTVLRTPQACGGCGG